ncbi:MAG: T9SS type A sorting domain-containing protein [Bacteroidia bacterium]|nr:T9SS type A sorting domain-containing protein [Bacteroidia bacterium]
MKRKITLAVLLCGLHCTAQMFQKTYNFFGAPEVGLSVHQTSDGGYVVAGTSSGTSNFNAVVFKTDASGDFSWTRLFDNGRREEFRSVVQTPGGGFLAAGVSNSFQPDSLNEFYLVKLSAIGNVLWSKTYGWSMGLDENGANYICPTADGGYMIGGFGDSFGTIYMKIDSMGNVIWDKKIPGVIFGSDGVKSIKQTTDGGFIIAGNVNSYFKTDGSGNVIWGKQLGFPPNIYVSYAQQTSDGGYIITGYSNSFGSGGYDMLLLKTNSSGDTLWCKTYGTSDADYVYSALQTTDGGYILVGGTGPFYLDVYLVKTDANGNVLWSKKYYDVPGDQTGYSVEQTSDGGFIISSNSNAGSNHVYLIKTDAIGTSGCNETNVATLVTTPSIPITAASTLSGPFLSYTNAVVSNSNIPGIATTICYNFPTATSDEKAFKNSTLFPNPFTTTATIKFPTDLHSATFRLYNLYGQLVQEKNNISGKEILLTRENLGSGVYVYEVTDKEKKICGGKAVVY